METPLPPQAVKLARQALARHAECFWTRRPDAPVVDRSDLELIVRRLRENGKAGAWKTAREIEACL
jgi:hypothetical protein